MEASCRGQSPSYLVRPLCLYQLKKTHDNSELQICCPHRNSNWPNSEHNSEAYCLNVLSILRDIGSSHSGVADDWKSRDVLPDVSENHNGFSFSGKRSDLTWRWRHCAFETSGTTHLKKLRHSQKAWMFTIYFFPQCHHMFLWTFVVCLLVVAIV